MRGRIVALAVVCAAGIAIALLRGSGTATTRAQSEAASTTPAAAAPASATPPKADAPPLREAATPGAGLDRAALASPQSAVQSALRLLESGDLDLFRQTFLPHVQPQVTPEAFAACRRRVRQVPVRPDWEMAEEVTSAGHRVVRVSMFGKSMTGFHDVDGRWLADALWCLPVGVP